MDELAVLKNRTKPSKPKDPFAKPRGTKTKILSNIDISDRVSLELENEAAEILAKEGYDVEQNPFVSGLKNPDYKIEGKIFDCYSPYAKNKSVRGIWSEIAEKIEKGQTERVLINLKNWEGDLIQLQKQFSDWSIEVLQEVMYITKNGKINHIKLTK
ncbi:hypothetical protein [Chryseobacterium aquaticum]|uniref:CdiA C-terminal domain-containing protein n=1 Tax=Chryseobacterium aquaticum TaxID=452084 RepID=UPI003F6E8245